MSEERSDAEAGGDIAYVTATLVRAGLRATPEQIAALAQRYRQTQRELAKLREWLDREDEPATTFSAADAFRDDDAETRA